MKILLLGRNGLLGWESQRSLAPLGKLLALRRHPTLAGLCNLASAGETTGFGYARYVLEQAAMAGVPLKAKVDDLQAVASEQYSTPARRPRNSRLSTHKLQTAFDVALPAWQVGVVRMLTEVLETHHEGA